MSSAALLLSLFAAVTFSIPAGRLIPELEQVFGRVEWIVVEQSPVLQISGGVPFETGQVEIQVPYARNLRRLARILVLHPQASVSLLGRASSSGVPASDEKLALNRAGSVRNVLLHAMRETCAAVSGESACGNLDRRVASRAGLPAVSAVSGEAERAQADRVDILIRF